MIACTQPHPCQFAAALRTVAEVLGERHAARIGSRFYFPLAGRLYVAVSPDDAGRFRIETCYGTHPIATLWASARDRDRLAGLVREMQTDLAALAA